MSQRWLSTILVISGAALLFGFQNCGMRSAPGALTGVTSSSAKQNVIGQTAGYNQLSYSPKLTLEDIQTHALPLKLSVDLSQGTLAVSGGQLQQQVSCALDAPRLASLQSILEASQICQPAPPPPGTAVCMAISVSDIELSNGTSTVLLRPIICGDGVVLCGGADSALRTLLNDLKNSPPVGCSI